MVGWDRSREGCSCEEEAKKGRRIGGDGEDGMRVSSRARGKGGVGGGRWEEGRGSEPPEGDRVVGIWRHPPIGVTLGGKVVSCCCMCATGRYVTVMDGRKCRCQGGCSRGISCSQFVFHVCDDGPGMSSASFFLDSLWFLCPLRGTVAQESPLSTIHLDCRRGVGRVAAGAR